MSESLGPAIADLQFQARAAHRNEYPKAVGHTHIPTGPLNNTVTRQAEEVRAGLASIVETTQAMVANLKGIKEATESGITSTSASRDTAATILGSAATVLDGTNNEHAQNALTHFRNTHDGFTEAAASTSLTDSGTGEVLDAAIQLEEALGSAATILARLETSLEPLPGHATTTYEQAVGARQENLKGLQELARYREDLGIGGYEPLL